MSFSSKLSTVVDEVIQTFISKVADKYKIDKKELNTLWTTGRSDVQREIPAVAVAVAVGVVESKIDLDVLLKCNKAELVALCKIHGCKCSGTKDQLIAILVKKDNMPKDEVKEVKEVKKKKSVKKKSVKKKSVKKKSVKKKSKAVSSIESKLIANISDQVIKRNGFDRYEHSETGLVFENNESRTVIGVQMDDGSIRQLNDNDIDQCNAFKFKYKLPNNLDAKDKKDKKEEKEEEEEEEEEEELVSEEELDQGDITEDDNYVSD